MYVKFLDETETEMESEERQLVTNEGGEESDPDVEMSDADLKESEKLLDTGTPPRGRTAEGANTRPSTPSMAAPPAPPPPPPPPPPAAKPPPSLPPPQEPTIQKRACKIKNLSRSEVFQQVIEPVANKKLPDPQIPGVPTSKHAENDRNLNEQVPENTPVGNTFCREKIMLMLRNLIVLWLVK
jgi:hypothetical protein